MKKQHSDYTYQILIILFAYFIFSDSSEAHDFGRAPSWTQMITYEEGEYMYFVGSWPIGGACTKSKCDHRCAKSMASNRLKKEVEDYLGVRYPAKIPPIRKLKTFATENMAYALGRVRLKDLQKKKWFWQ